ncbi:peptidoglycan-binding domain-containing protein [Aureimonas sp. N4]|uniref:peptidoglycan-binding domain-containing protein n=1 Tax=Aureimonas sp. N4 TaxID=1638165 RepID=UPI00178CB361|nr:peptidoglycan-binding domain-containing protein [Aureimonas sp. N4]
MLRLGAKGACVRELRALLVRAGEPVKVDGDFGQTTRDAVRALQKRLGLAVDGVAGPETMAAFTTFRTSPDEKLGARMHDNINEMRRELRHQEHEIHYLRMVSDAYLRHIAALESLMRTAGIQIPALVLPIQAPPPALGGPGPA